MILNLLALAWFALVLLAAATLIARSLRLVPNIRGYACARCGEPAERLTDFTCPRCHHDVRQRGLVAPRAESARSIFWRLIAWTAVVAVVALGVTALTRVMMPPRQFFSLSSAVRSPKGLGSSIDRIECYAVGACVRGGRIVEADLFADLHLRDGRVSVLHVRVPGAHASWTLSGQQHEEPRGPYTIQLLHEWVGRSGATIEPFDGPPEIDPLADLHERIQLIATGSNPLMTRVGMGGSGLWRGGGGIDFSNAHYRLAATLWPTIWLAGIAIAYRRLRSRTAAAPSTSPSAEPVRALAEASA